jgi:glycosyltransferase involved in cell wall biosynthesis
MLCPEDPGEIKPNFYHACVKNVFPDFGIRARYLPILAGTPLFRVLRLFRLGEETASRLTTLWWVWRNRKSFDLIIGWHGSGLVVAFFRAIIGWRKPRLCLILYRLYNPDGPSWLLLAKKFLFRIASRGADYILSVDHGQASAFARELSRKPGTTLAFRYGLDYAWFKQYLEGKEDATFNAQRLFSPGSAYRDDKTLLSAISDLPVELWRTQLSGETANDRRSGKIGAALVRNMSNLSYPDYVSTCLDSSVVVISAHSSDKPVGLTSLLECMALGRPVVITRGLSSHDYVVDGVTALEFQEGDPDSLRRQISRLLHDPALRADLVRNARTALTREHSLDVTGADLAQMIIAMTRGLAVSDAAGSRKSPVTQGTRA